MLLSPSNWCLITWVDKEHDVLLIGTAILAHLYLEQLTWWWAGEPRFYQSLPWYFRTVLTEKGHSDNANDPYDPFEHREVAQPNSWVIANILLHQEMHNSLPDNFLQHIRSLGSLAEILAGHRYPGKLILIFYSNQLNMKPFPFIGYAHGLQKCRSAIWCNRNYRRWTPLHSLCPYSGEF